MAGGGKGGCEGIDEEGGRGARGMEKERIGVGDPSFKGGDERREGGEEE